MNKLAAAAFAAALFCAGVQAQQQSPPDKDSTSQKSQDVPHQQPGTNNPDVGKQRQPTPDHASDPAQQSADVPHQQPGTNNPDVSKQRKPSSKKAKHAKTTGSSSGTT